MRSILGVGVLAAAMALAGPAMAQSSALEGGISRSADPSRETLERMMKPISIELVDARLEDVMAFLADVTGATLDVVWQDDRSADGLDSDLEVSIKVEGVTALTLLERVLDKARIDAFSESTWQLSPTGEMEIGPKSALNRRAFVKLYDINDLLFDIPSFTEFPTLDLDSVLGQGEGGGEGSIFEDEGEQEGARQSREDRISDITDILITTIEPEQWVDNGGDAASVREYNGSLLIRAPDYIHRQIDGYDFWPQGASRAARPKMTRYGPGAERVQRPEPFDSGTRFLSGPTSLDRYAQERARQRRAAAEERLLERRLEQRLREKREMGRRERADEDGGDGGS